MMQPLFQTKYFEIVYRLEQRPAPRMIYPLGYRPELDRRPYKPWYRCLRTLRLRRRTSS